MGKKKVPEKSEMDLIPQKEDTTEKVIEETPVTVPEKTELVIKPQETPEPTTAQLPDEDKPSMEISDAVLVKKPVTKKTKKVSKKVSVETDSTVKDTVTEETEIVSIETKKKVPEKSEMDLIPQKEDTTEKVIEETPVTVPDKTELVIKPQETPEPTTAQLPDEDKPSMEVSDAVLVKKPVTKETKKVSKKVSVEMD